MSHAGASAGSQPAPGNNTTPPPSAPTQTLPPFYEFDPQAAPEVVLDGIETQEKTAGSAGVKSATDRDEGTLLGSSRNTVAVTRTPADVPVQANSTGEASKSRPFVAYLYWPWIWARRKPYLAAAALTFGLGIIALIVLPIVLHGIALDGVNSSGGNSSPPSSTSSAPVSSATPTTTPPIAAQCTNNASWVQNASFLGISDSNGKPWPYKLTAAPSAAECCTACFVNFPQGCQGWAYLPWNDTPVPCTIVYGWNSTQGESDTCPDGKARITLTSSAGHAGSVGGPGPCGQVS